LFRILVRSAQVASAMRCGVVSPCSPRARAARAARSELIRALNRMDAHSQRNSGEGVLRSIAMPSSEQ
jgi:hypothetical protein